MMPKKSFACPHCGKQICPAAMLGSITSDAKAASSRENGKKGGRPPKQKQLTEPEQIDETVKRR